MNALYRDLKICVENAMELHKKSVDSDIWRLQYHLMPPVGWLNDPNGLCQFNGYYHVFYQYSPLNANGGLKFWGHFRSIDLVNFEDMGVALYPDQTWDVHGVYSGSALVENGKIHFFYTGNVKKLGNYDFIREGREHNTIHAVSEDGVNIEKTEVVIKDGEYPEIFTKHIRDPKVWKENGEYYMVLGARDLNNRGQIILYKSKNLSKWEYIGISAGPLDKMGYMWECPDYFKLGDKYVLFISPQGIEAEGDLYQNIYQSGYFIGNLNLETGKFEHGEFTELDRGFDFYAPQTFEDEKGRRIMIAWMGLPDIDKDYYTNPTVEHGWQHALTIPRELVLEGNKIVQKPIEELKKLRKSHFNADVNVNGYTKVNGLNGEVYELCIDVCNVDNELKIILRDDAQIVYDANQRKISLMLGKAGYGRKIRRVSVDSLRDIRVFSDTSSLEIFINGGQEVFTTRIYPEQGSSRIEFEGNAQLQINKWGI